MTTLSPAPQSPSAYTPDWVPCITGVVVDDMPPVVKFTDLTGVTMPVLVREVR